VKKSDSMNVVFVSCWAYLRIYSVQAAHLKQTLENQFGLKIDVLTSNCGCFYEGFRDVFSSFSNYESVMTDTEAQFLKLPHFRAHREKNVVSRSARSAYRRLAEPLRGKWFSGKAKGYPLIHFHQSAEAFGIETLKWLLRFNKNRSKIIVTVHRLSAEQEKEPAVNQTYNGCDAVVVDTDFLRNKLIAWGVRPEKIHLVKYGAFISPAGLHTGPEAIMFAGSPLIDVKGFEYLAPALRLLKDEGKPIRVKLHGFHMAGHKEWADEIIRKEKIEDVVRWVAIPTEGELISEYRNSYCCLVPYTDYPGSFPASLAMANGIPVIASDDWGIGEYLNGGGLIFKSKSVESLAAVLRQIRDSLPLRDEMGNKARVVAERDFSWPCIAEKYLKIYKELI